MNKFLQTIEPKQYLDKLSQVESFLFDEGIDLKPGDYIVKANGVVMLVVDLEIYPKKFTKHELKGHKKAEFPGKTIEAIRDNENARWSSDKYIYDLAWYEDKLKISFYYIRGSWKNEILYDTRDPEAEPEKLEAIEYEGLPRYRKEWTVYRGDVYAAMEKAHDQVWSGEDEIDFSVFGLTPPTQEQSKETGVAILGDGQQAKKGALIKWQSLKEFEQNTNTVDKLVQFEFGMLKSKFQGKVQKLNDQLQAVLVPINRMINRLHMLIKQLEVYLGLKNGMKQIGFGPNAPAGTPVYIFQNPMFMDEEVGDPQGEGINFKRIGQFDKWLTEIHPKFGVPNHRISMPYEKCICMFRVRREARNYRHSERPTWVTIQMENADQEVYVVMKNGENIWRIWTAGDDGGKVNFKFGDKFFPDAGEIGALKERIIEQMRKQMEKEDEEGNEYDNRMKNWTRNETDEMKESFETTELEYKLNLLMLQGMLDREEIYPDLHGKIDLFSEDILKNPFVHWLFNNDYDRLIDNSDVKFMDWLEEKNKGIKKGSRVYWLKPSWYNRSHSEEFTQGIHDSRRFTDRAGTGYNEHTTASYSKRPAEGVYIVEMQTAMSYAPDDIRREILQMGREMYNKTYSRESMYTKEAIKSAQEKYGYWNLNEHLPARHAHNQPWPYAGPYVWYHPGGTTAYGWNSGGEARKNRLKYAIDFKTDLMIHFDTIEEEDFEIIDRFLYDRRERQKYIDIIPLLMGVMKARRKELDAEKRFSEQIQLFFSEHFNIEDKQAFEKICLDAVKWYKLKNKYKRPLPIGNWDDLDYYKYRVNGLDFSEEENKATRMIVAKICKDLGVEVPVSKSTVGKASLDKTYQVLLRGDWHCQYSMHKLGPRILFINYEEVGKRDFEKIVRSMRKRLKPCFNVSSFEWKKGGAVRIWLNFMEERSTESTNGQWFEDNPEKVFIEPDQPNINVLAYTSFYLRYSNATNMLKLRTPVAGKKDIADIIKLVKEGLNPGLSIERDDSSFFNLEDYRVLEMSISSPRISFSERQSWDGKPHKIFRKDALEH